MKHPFYKYHGTGNDFVLLDNRQQLFPKHDHDLVKSICHRRFGIGADGLILLEEAEGYDFSMVYYNADGQFGSLCGNGGRCIVAFARYLGLISDQARFLAADGVHEATCGEEGLIRLKMNPVNEIEELAEHYYLNTGSPHYVAFVDQLEGLDVVEEGRKIRYNDRFAEEGTNVNFVANSDKGLSIRTYERGVEGETWSCGTGVTAAVLAAANAGFEPASGRTRITTLGGELWVSHEPAEGGGYDHIWLEGPAKQVFSGTLDDGRS